MGKKCNEVKKIRKITFLHGQVDKTVTNLKSSDGLEMIKFFTDLIANHPDYICYSRRSKKTEKEKEKVSSSGEVNEKSVEEIEPKPRNPLRDELVFGLTEIMKKIQSKMLIGVVVEDPLTIHLQATLHDLCKQFDVPFLLSKNLNQIGEVLKLSKLTCFGFLKKTEEPNSLCHSLYKIFLSQNGSYRPEKGQLNPCITPKEPVNKVDQQSEIEFVFDMPPEDNFYIPKEEMTDSSVERNSEVIGKKMDDFIKTEKDLTYFPPRPYFREIKLTLPWIGVEVKKIQKLGKSLFAVKSPLEKVQYHLNDTLPFSEPKTTQLPSSGRVREKRKKFKKVKQDPNRRKKTN